MAVTEVCGWECRVAISGTLSAPDERHWDNVAGVPAISTTTVRTGTAALRCNAAGATVNLQKTIARTVVSGRVYVRFASFPASSTPFLRFVNASGASTIEVDSAGLVKGKVGASALSASAATLSTGTWYLIDFLLDTSTGTASLKVKVDGGTEINPTQAQASANNTSVNVGITGAVTSDVFYDDLVLGNNATDYPFGAGTVERMKPTRDGTHSFTAADFGYDTAGADVATSATDVWDKLNDDDMTSTADLIRQKVIRSTGYVEVGFGSAPQTYDAQAVNVVTSYHAAGTGADTFGTKVNDNGTLKAITDEAGDGLSDVSDTTIFVNEKVLTVAPSTSVAWTSTRLGAVLVRGGYSTDVNAIPYWDAVMLEVAYLTPSGTNAAAENAAGTGTAYNPAADVKPTSNASTGTGAAANAAAGLKPNAANSAGTGAAGSLTTQIRAGIQASTGTGSAGTGKGGVGGAANVGAGTGAAGALSARLSDSPGDAAGSGTAGGPSSQVAVNVGVGAGTGAAGNATVSVVTATNAAAGNAAGTGAAYNGAAGLGTSAGVGTGTGAAGGTASSLTVGAEAASGTGAAYNPIASTVTAVYVDAGLAAGAGTAHGAMGAEDASAIVATGTGAAYNATTAIVSNVSVNAGLASGTGTARNAFIRIVDGGAKFGMPFDGVAPIRGIAVDAGLAHGIGIAYDPFADWDDDETAVMLLLLDAA